MSLTKEQAEFVAGVQAKIGNAGSNVLSCAQMLINAKKGIVKEQADEAYATTFGDEAVDGTAAADLKAQLVLLDSAIDSLFSTGMISQTRKEMEERLETEAGAPPPTP